MRIGIIFPTFWAITEDIYKIYGGLEPRTTAVARYLADDGYEVLIFSPRGSSLPHKNIKIYHGEHWAWNGRSPPPYELEKDLITHNEDILKTCDIILEDNHFGYFRYLKSLNVDAYPKVANSWDHHPDNINSLPNYQQNIIAVSKWTMMALREKFKNQGHNFWHAYSGLIRDHYPEEIDINDKDENLFLFLARFSTVKGPDIVIELAKEFKDDRFVLIGDTLFTNEAHYARTIKTIGDTLDNVTIIFNASYKEKIHYLKLASGVLHPGRWDEPLGWDMLEGLYFGAPILAFDRGAIREIYSNEKHGYIIPFSQNDQENIEMYKKGFRRFKKLAVKPEDCRQRILDNFDFRRHSYPVYKEVLAGIKNQNPLK